MPNPSNGPPHIETPGARTSRPADMETCQGSGREAENAGHPANAHPDIGRARTKSIHTHTHTHSLSLSSRSVPSAPERPSRSNKKLTRADKVLLWRLAYAADKASAPNPTSSEKRKKNYRLSCPVPIHPVPSQLTAIFLDAFSRGAVACGALLRWKRFLALVHGWPIIPVRNHFSSASFLQPMHPWDFLAGDSTLPKVM